MPSSRTGPQTLPSHGLIGGLAPGQTQQVRGKIYLVKPDAAALRRRYEADFPERARH